MRRVPAVSLVLVVCASTALAALAPRTPTPEEAWRQLHTLAPDLVSRTRTGLLAGKDLARPPLTYTDHRYQARLDSGKSYGQVLCRFYFNRVLRAKTVAETFEIVRDLSASAAEFHTRNTPLLADAETVERLTRAVREALEKRPADAAALKAVTFDAAGADELTTSLRKLSESVSAGTGDDAAVWAAEAHGAASRLVDLLRWVDLQTDWLVDLCTVFDTFSMCIETSDRDVAAAGGWKNFMFGRVPGASSIMELSVGDVLTCELLLSDLFTTSEADAARMGKLRPDAKHYGVIPAHRDAFLKVHDALPAGSRAVLVEITTTPYELTAFNSNLRRYDDEKELDGLVTSLERCGRRCTKPTVTRMMEVIHIAQGAFGSTTSARDRHHKQMVEWAGKLSGKPEQAVAEAHACAYGFYTKGGEKHYQGAIWTMHKAFEVEACDCIRGSQMIGSVYANAGYGGLHPVRICRGSLQQKIVAASGHTFVCLETGGRNVCLDPLVKQTFLKPFEKMHDGDAQVLSVARGYRTLDSFAAGEIRFPQGPLKAVRLRVPYYGLERKGFPTTSSARERETS